MRRERFASPIRHPSPEGEQCVHVGGLQREGMAELLCHEGNSGILLDEAQFAYYDGELEKALELSQQA